MNADTPARRTFVLAIALGLVALGLALTGALIGLRGDAGVRSARAASAAAAALIDSSQAGLPQWLSETGLYAADGSIDPRNAPFSPQYPLWTDGAAKARWIQLPAGARIDVGDADAWRFPVGTKLWKEFAWDGHKVETRFFWLTPTGWRYGSYVWNAQQSEARLAPAEGLPRAFALAGGKQHAVPGRADCLACHASAPAPVLGFTALQLSDDRDPLAPHAESLPRGAVTLAALVADDRFEPPRPEWVTRPPRIAARSATERAALGYLAGNCGACHNSSGPLARLGFDLLHRVSGEGWAPEPVLATAQDAGTRFRIPGIAADSTRLIAAGAPERSALHYRLSSRRAAAQMPPLGTAIADSVASKLIAQWIRELAATPGAAQLTRR